MCCQGLDQGLPACQTLPQSFELSPWSQRLFFEKSTRNYLFWDHCCFETIALPMLKLSAWISDLKLLHAKLMLSPLNSPWPYSGLKIENSVKEKNHHLESAVSLWGKYPLKLLQDWRDIFTFVFIAAFSIAPKSRNRPCVHWRMNDVQMLRTYVRECYSGSIKG